MAVLTVQSGATVAKGLFPVLGAAATASVRNGLSAMILLAVFRPPLRRLTAGQWRAVVPYGVTIGVMNLLFYETIARIPLGLGVTLEFIGPLGLAIVGSRRLLDVLWVGLAALGIALIAPWQAGSAIDPVGVALGLLTGVCWAAYIVLGGRVAQRLPGGPAVAVGMLLATLTVLPFAVAGGGLARFSPRLFVSGVVLALLSSALPFTLEMHALRALPGRTFSILMSLEPAVGALWGLLFLNERLTRGQSAAVGLVIAASIGATLTATKVPVHLEV
ncbi:MAG: DMT family transporter [Acidobacteriota bacterium]